MRIEAADLAHVISTAWHQLTAEERKGYESKARQERQALDVSEGEEVLWGSVACMQWGLSISCEFMHAWGGLGGPR